MAARTITDYLGEQLDLAVASRSGHQAKLHFLAIEQGKWALRMRAFYREGTQPFGGPHPEYGPMSFGDFIIVLGMIESARAVIRRRMQMREAAE